MAKQTENKTTEAAAKAAKAAAKAAEAEAAAKAAEAEAAAKAAEAEAEAAAKNTFIINTVKAIAFEQEAAAAAKDSIKTILEKSTKQIVESLLSATDVSGRTIKYNVASAKALLKALLIHTAETEKVPSAWKIDKETGIPSGEKAARNTAGGKLYNAVSTYLYNNYDDNGNPLSDSRKAVKAAEQKLADATAAAEKEEQQQAAVTAAATEARQQAITSLTDRDIVTLWRAKHGTTEASLALFATMLKDETI